MTPPLLEVVHTKSFYRPGEPVILEIGAADIQGLLEAHLIASVFHLATPILSTRQEVRLGPGQPRFQLRFLPPEEAPRGYGLDLRLETANGEILGTATTAFDVLSNWTQTPRYGFLSDFSPERTDINQTMAALNRYHINGLQFYDWMYRHEQFLTDEEPYIDLLGRQLSRNTVLALIGAARAHNVASMPYTAVYGASLAFFQEHPDWGLYHANGEPVYFGEDFMAIMDLRPQSPWTRHLMAEFEQILAEMPFDGIHLDQYGEPKSGCDMKGASFDLDDPIVDMINATSRLVRQKQPDGAVVFNAVTNWPVEKVAPSDQDLVYIEVWDPYLSYSDLQYLVLNGQKLGRGKPVVLAAYIDPAFEHNARLMDAVIFGNGGSRIELGENDGMLADPYFPNYQRMSTNLAETMARYYSFTVRYQDVIGPRTRDASEAFKSRIWIEGASVTNTPQMGKILVTLRETEEAAAISLVNFQGIEQGNWAQQALAAPVPLANFSIEVKGVERPVKTIWTASPDDASIAPQTVEFTQEDGCLKFLAPSLGYWRLIGMEWA